jgi:hypothetical protein
MRLTRGSAFVEEAARDMLRALRTFRRAPLVAITVTSTVGLWLALVAVALTVSTP